MIKILKHFILIIITLVLITPLLQKEFSFFNETPLKGAFTPITEPDLILENWFSGEYQLQYEKYFNDSIGFRSLFVRINNQLEYSLFDNVSAQGIVIGKEGVLYQEVYIQSYLGEDFIGDEKIISEVKKIDFVQKELLKRGKKMLYVIAPSKASIYPDNFPSVYDTLSKTTSNYDAYIKYFNQYDIEYFDVRTYFMQIKDKVQYPLFPKNGTHWSGYGVALVADSIYNRLSILFNKDLANIEILPGREDSINLEFTDNDIGKALNLYFEQPNWKMYYPKINFHSHGKSRINALIIGDSFAQSFFGFGHYFYYIFSQNSKYFNYYKTIFWPHIHDDNMRNIGSYNLSELVNENELIMVIFTEQNLNGNSFGFFDDLYVLFKNVDSTSNIEEIQNIILQIKNDKIWYNNMVQQAKERNISIDEMLRKNAIYTIKNRKR